jgi:hypothetical protein
MISWGGATGASGYTYVVKDASGTTLRQGTDYTVVNNGMANSSATISGLTAGKTYSVVVIATDTFGQTSSTPVTITTVPSTPTPPPRQVSRSLGQAAMGRLPINITFLAKK